MRLSEREQQALQMDVVTEWRQTHSLVLFEMLKQVAEPLIANELLKNKDSGVRQDDLRRAAEDLLTHALESYAPSCGPLVHWIETTLSNLHMQVDSLRAQAMSKRGSQSP